MELPLSFDNNFISGEEEKIQSFLLDCTQECGVYYVPRLYGYNNPSEIHEVLYRIADSYGIRIINYSTNTIEFELNGKRYKREFIK